MICSVLGCGFTAQGWQEVKTDLSIGVNDVYKFGHHPDYLVVIDSPRRFTQQRKDIILSTKSKFFCRDDQWKGLIKEYQKVRLQQFFKYLKKGNVYCSKTSTFVALSIAFNMGATDVVLFGVDFANHQIFHPGDRLYDYEMRQYEKFCKMMKEQGTTVWVSSQESKLSQFLPLFVWKDINADLKLPPYDGPKRTGEDMELTISL